MMIDMPRAERHGSSCGPLGEQARTSGGRDRHGQRLRREGRRQRTWPTRGNLTQALRQGRNAVRRRSFAFDRGDDELGKRFEAQLKDMLKPSEQREIFDSDCSRPKRSADDPHLVGADRVDRGAASTSLPTRWRPATSRPRNSFACPRIMPQLEPVAAAAREVRRLRAELEVLERHGRRPDRRGRAQGDGRGGGRRRSARKPARGRASAGAEAAAARRGRRARRRCSKSAPAPAATRRRCSRATCCACTSASPRAGLAVRADLCSASDVGGFKEASPRSTARACSPSSSSKAACTASSACR